MSLLSDIQGRPERVRSIVNLLAAFPGQSMDFDEISRWLQPPSLVGTDPNSTVIRQSLGAARSLGLITASGSSYSLDVEEAPGSFDALADYTHRRLVHIPDDDADAVVLKAYAYMLLRCDRESGTRWISDSAVSALADAINSGLRSEDAESERLFNPSKLPAWRDWLVHMGLGWESVPDVSFFPDLTNRLFRTLRECMADGTLPDDRELDAFDVLQILRGRMPYLDGGYICRAVEQTSGLRLKDGQASWALSAALRELHDDGAIVLHQVSDATRSLQLASDRLHSIQYAVAVTLKPLMKEMR